MHPGSLVTVALVLAPSVLAYLFGSTALSVFRSRPTQVRGFGLAVAGTTLGVVTFVLNLAALAMVNDLIALDEEAGIISADGDIPPTPTHRTASAETGPVTPANPALAAYQSGMQRRTSDPQAAIDDFTQALSLDPGFGPALLERGRLRAELQDLRGAIEDLTELLGIEPEHPDAYLARARAYQKSEDEVSALADWRRYLDLDPAGAAAQEARAAIRELEHSLDGR